ncbi:class F sortase [Streptomyces sp. URMC 123]|uniref:class F sortase n=1 Tax=Streptomyces sp. URMC 123 TaxID=3423403 RepID=UPI003F1CE48F
MPPPRDRTAPVGSPGLARLLTGVTWAVVLLGLWLWGREVTGARPVSDPGAGGVAAVGRPAARPPRALAPLPEAAPMRLEVPSLGIAARIVERGLDADGAVDPPPYGTPDAVGWYGDGPRPGSAGAALLVGHVDTETRPAVFHRLGQVRAGERVRVVRADRSVAEFTVEGVEVFPRERFDARRVYGARKPGRAELRLITCGGAYDRAARSYTANVVVSAYLTGAR